jgi:hypothetical protein
MKLARLTCKVRLAYLDNIIISSQNSEDRLNQLDAFLSHLHGAGLSLKLRKYYFVKKTVRYLNHVTSLEELAVSEKNTVALKETQPPTT